MPRRTVLVRSSALTVPSEWVAEYGQYQAVRQRMLGLLGSP